MKNECQWEEVAGFQSYEEYERTLSSIEGQIKSGIAEAVQLEQSRRWGTAFDEKWFRCRSGQVWRLVAPDPPFRGIFKPLAG